MSNYYEKYLKYKQKYINLKLSGGATCLKYGFQQHRGECWHDSLSMLIMQSNATADIFESQIKFFIDDKNNIDMKKLNTHHEYLKSLFTPENIDKNAFLLPVDFYIFYLKNKSNMSFINSILKEFFAISYNYITDHILRANNRILNDSSMQRDNTYLKTDRATIFDPSPQEISNEINIASPNERTKLQRQLSTNATEFCTQRIKQIYKLLESKTSTPELKTLDKDIGGNLDEQLLALEILNMYIMRSHPDYKNLYIDKQSLFMENSFYNHLQNVKLIDLLHPKSDSIFLGVLVSGNFTRNDTGHAISLYKCGTQELLYDDNQKSLIPCDWYSALTSYLSSDNISIFQNIINSAFKSVDKTKYATVGEYKITRITFIRKRMSLPTDNDKLKEIKFILNKINFYLYNDSDKFFISKYNENLKILYARLQELLQALFGKDTLPPIPQSSMFDMDVFNKIKENTLPTSYDNLNEETGGNPSLFD